MPDEATTEAQRARAERFRQARDEAMGKAEKAGQPRRPQTIRERIEQEADKLRKEAAAEEGKSEDDDGAGGGC